MAFVDDLARVGVESSASQHPGAFYSGTADLSPGCGVFYGDVSYSFYDPSVGDIAVQDGTVLILTHECDIDQENKRPFNDRAIVCPVIDLDSFAKLSEQESRQDYATSLIRDAASEKVSRLFFLPRPLIHIPIPALQFGGLLFLNMLTNVHVDQLAMSAGPVCALSTYAMQRLDMKMQNHFFRPKAESLAMLM